MDERAKTLRTQLIDHLGLPSKSVGVQRRQGNYIVSIHSPLIERQKVINFAEAFRLRCKQDGEHIFVDVQYSKLATQYAHIHEASLIKEIIAAARELEIGQTERIGDLRILCTKHLYSLALCDDVADRHWFNRTVPKTIAKALVELGVVGQKPLKQTH